MKKFQFVHCESCNMDYHIQWEDDDFEEPYKCVRCGSEDITIEHSGVLT